MKKTATETTVETEMTEGKYKVILFDFDGTIADTIPLIMDSFQYVFISLTGEPADNEFILSTIGQPLESTFRILDESLRPEAMKLYFKYNEEHLESGVGIFIGIQQMLEGLRAAGTITGIVTSKRRSVTLFTINQFDLGRYFDVTITREDSELHKPNPQPLYKALEVLSETVCCGKEINLGNVLYVGDSIHDLHCARNAGINTALVDWTYMDKDFLRSESPEHWILKADEIVDLSAAF